MECTNYVVDAIIKETAFIKSFYLKREDGKFLKRHLPGQYLLFSLPIKNKKLMRFYTISDYFNGNNYRISIKKELAPDGSTDTPNGLGSSYFHEQVEVGTILKAKGPSGEFTVDSKSNQPLVLIAGGIGVTPILSMLNAISKENPLREVFIYLAMQNKINHPFKEQIEKLINQHHSFNLTVFYDKATDRDIFGKDYHVVGRFSLNKIKTQLGNLTEYNYYICGPSPMMNQITQDLNQNNVAKENINTEAFGPASPSGHRPDEIVNNSVVKNGGQLTVEFEKSGIILDWDNACSSILELAETNGIPIDAGCLFGDCGTCITKIIDGDVVYNHTTGIDAGLGSCLPCSCKPINSLRLDA